mgnify:CR=1 FL=1
MDKATRLRFYEEIKEEVNNEMGEDLPMAELHSIIDSQFKIMMYGFSKGVPTHLPMFGKFIPFDMDFYAEKVIIPNKELQKQLREQGNEEEASLVFKDSIARFKKVVKEKGQEETIKANTLVKIPNVDGSTDGLDIFKNLR